MSFVWLGGLWAWAWGRDAERLALAWNISSEEKGHLIVHFLTLSRLPSYREGPRRRQRGPLCQRVVVHAVVLNDADARPQIGQRMTQATAQPTSSCLPPKGKPARHIGGLTSRLRPRLEAEARSLLCAFGGRSCLFPHALGSRVIIAHDVSCERKML